ncbi:transmembrane protein 26 [Lampris incognitus]|uniref:transmembrane protein 26 n=1 Tax=Lampris incognitus TaxID=2546036 RepID=UPI0024B5F2BB|nr:transmembrane protein 26 [Lampris incognitus]
MCCAASLIDRFRNVLLALLSRVLFAVHGVVMVWRVVVEMNQPLYWLLLSGVCLLGLEMTVTLRHTRNAEWKWFSPMVFLYLSTVIPSIWCLELNVLHIMHSEPKPDAAPATELNLHGVIKKVGPENWTACLEQTMFIVLVLGRWLMPKGEMSRDQLSQLLMVYMGLGADILDILEIFDSFKDPKVKTNTTVIIIGLVLFSWALMQFPLVLTNSSATKGHSSSGQQSPLRSKGGAALSSDAPTPSTCCSSSEVWSLLLTVCLQDGPFLLYRLYLIIQEEMLNHMMIFFTCKNIVMVLLELYRIFVVLCDQARESVPKERVSAARCYGIEQARGMKEEDRDEDGESGGEYGELGCHTDIEKINERDLGQVSRVILEQHATPHQTHSTRRLMVLAPASNSARTDEDTEASKKWRAKNEDQFTGKRNATMKGSEMFIKEHGLQGTVEAGWAKKKWQNLKRKYKYRDPVIWNRHCGCEPVSEGVPRPLEWLGDFIAVIPIITITNFIRLQNVPIPNADIVEKKAVNNDL